MRCLSIYEALCCFLLICLVSSTNFISMVQTLAKETEDDTLDGLSSDQLISSQMHLTSMLSKLIGQVKKRTEHGEEK